MPVENLDITQPHNTENSGVKNINQKEEKLQKK